MKDSERNLQHAMMSFALLGGLLVNRKGGHGAGDRATSQSSAFVPFKPRKHD